MLGERIRGAGSMAVALRVLLVSVVVAAAALTAACEPGSGESADVVDAASDIDMVLQLIDNRKWKQVGPEEDPFWADRPEGAEPCPAEFVYAEEEAEGWWFSVDTLECNYATASQPSLADVPEGWSLFFRIWHFRITLGEGPFTIALYVGDPPELLYSTTRPVPSESGLIFDELVTPRPIAAGEPLYWHIDNHGDNSWSIIELSARPPGQSALPSP